MPRTSSYGTVAHAAAGCSSACTSYRRQCTETAAPCCTRK